MTTSAAILALILDERNADERADVLRPLCAAYVAAHADEQVRDLALLDEDDAHNRYVEAYNRAAKPVLDGNPREVCVPEWAPLHPILLIYLARDERRQDERMMRYVSAMSSTLTIERKA